MAILGQKGHARAVLGFKGHAHSLTGHKGRLSGGTSRIPVFDASVGRGDAGAGLTVQGNTHNAVSSGQRDGQPREYRKSAMFDKRKPANKLESRKRNKTN